MSSSVAPTASVSTTNLPPAPAVAAATVPQAMTFTLMPGNVANVQHALASPITPPVTAPDAASNPKGRRTFYKKPRPVSDALGGGGMDKSRRNSDTASDRHSATAPTSLATNELEAIGALLAQRAIVAESERSDYPFSCSPMCPARREGYASRICQL
eukprot:Blabericola_migrator_1__6161@NODE_3107_length_2031_cov_24_672098_g1916_i1_p1_GENE_NODE_3107_length_2031_cov_24_672098_g1916_i1NODE_3107_length_2031_cov_24_672098_g1916_i1_p1_ORF_typecomplete_len157_score8_09_NODE_3107_length_2031_cov_24_672098_g1916_i19231393